MHMLAIPSWMEDFIFIKLIVLHNRSGSLSAHPSFLYILKSNNVGKNLSAYWIYMKTPQFNGSCSGAVNHPRDFETWNATLQLHSGQDGLLKASALWCPLWQPGDWWWLVLPYHPCRVTLTQTILDIRIHQATAARTSHRERQLPMYRSRSPAFGSGWLTWSLIFVYCCH